MGYDERRDDDPENIIDAGLRGLARGLEGLRGLVSQIADPTAPPRPKPLGPGRRPPRQNRPNLPHNAAGAREPIVDIFHEGTTIRVVADMPGADPATVQLRGSGTRLTIAAAGPARRYERTVTLPAPVAVAGAPPTTFINGILEALLPVAIEECPPEAETEPEHDRREEENDDRDGTAAGR